MSPSKRSRKDRIVRKMLLAVALLLILAGCKGSSLERGRGFVKSREVGTHPGATLFEDRLELRGGIVTCITALSETKDISVTCDWGT